MSDQVTPYTAEELEGLSGKHVFREFSGLCASVECLRPWPCPTARLLATVAEKRAMYTAAMEGVMLEKVYGECCKERGE